MMSEKQPLTLLGDRGGAVKRPHPTKAHRGNLRYLAIGAGLSYLLLKTLVLLSVWDTTSGWGGLLSHNDETRCPYQPKALHPRLNWHTTEQDRTGAVEHFSQAVVRYLPILSGLRY